MSCRTPSRHPRDATLSSRSQLESRRSEVALIDDYEGGAFNFVITVRTAQQVSASQRTNVPRRGDFRRAQRSYNDRENIQSVAAT